MFGPVSANVLGLGKKPAVPKTETVEEVVVKKPEPRKATGTLIKLYAWNLVMSYYGVIILVKS